MSTLRVAVWGLGRHARNRILGAVASAGGMELYGVCSRDSKVVDSSATTWNCRGWTEPDAMLADPEVDIVYAATPIGLHFEQGKRVLSAGKHFWCEKPLTCCLEDTAVLLETAARAERSLCEGHMYLHHPQFRRLQGYLAGDQLGKIVSINCRFGIPHLENPGFRLDRALGGGAFLDVGCYPVAALLELFPEDRAEVILSRLVVPTGSMIDSAGRAIIGLSSGAVADLEWRTGCAYRNEIDIWGEKGSIFSDRIFSKSPDHVPEFRLRNVQGCESTELCSASDHFVAMFEHFSTTIGDARVAAAERMVIARRAELLDRIWAAAGMR